MKAQVALEYVTISAFALIAFIEPTVILIGGALLVVG